MNQNKYSLMISFDEAVDIINHRVGDDLAKRVDSIVGYSEKKRRKAELEKQIAAAQAELNNLLNSF